METLSTEEVPKKVRLKKLTQSCRVLNGAEICKNVTTVLSKTKSLLNVTESSKTVLGKRSKDQRREVNNFRTQKRKLKENESKILISKRKIDRQSSARSSVITSKSNRSSKHLSDYISLKPDEKTSFGFESDNLYNAPPCQGNFVPEDSGSVSVKSHNCEQGTFLEITVLSGDAQFDCGDQRFLVDMNEFQNLTSETVFNRNESFYASSSRQRLTPSRIPRLSKTRSNCSQSEIEKYADEGNLNLEPIVTASKSSKIKTTSPILKNSNTQLACSKIPRITTSPTKSSFLTSDHMLQFPKAPENETLFQDSNYRSSFPKDIEVEKIPTYSYGCLVPIKFKMLKAAVMVELRFVLSSVDFGHEASCVCPSKLFSKTNHNENLLDNGCESEVSSDQFKSVETPKIDNVIDFDRDDVQSSLLMKNSRKKYMELAARLSITFGVVCIAFGTWFFVNCTSLKDLYTWLLEILEFI